MTYFEIAPMVQKTPYFQFLLQAIFVRFIYVAIVLIVIVLIHRKIFAKRITKKQLCFYIAVGVMGPLLILAPFLIWEYNNAPSGYSLNDENLIIHLRARDIKYPLSSLSYAGKDNWNKFKINSDTPLKGHSGTIDGYWGTYGKFSTKEYTFSMYATNMDKLIVLGWPDKYIVISPHNPDNFLDNIVKTGTDTIFYPIEKYRK